MKPYSYAARMNVLVTILMDDSKQARIVIHDQSWKCLSEVLLLVKGRFAFFFSSPEYYSTLAPDV